MLVALAVTLVMMAAVVNLFANISGSIRNRRAVIEVNGQLRQVRQRLAQDLEGATAKGQPAHGSRQNWTEPGDNSGYIEIIEGQWSDSNPSLLLDGTDTPSSTPPNPELEFTTSLVPGSQIVNPATGAVTNGQALGDWDDILALTVRSESEPFKAMVPNPISGQMELKDSPLAEVVWFAWEQLPPAGNPSRPEDGMRRIYRHVRLILPSQGPWNAPPDNVSTHFDVATGKYVANTLGDLTKRENRVARIDNSAFPHLIDTSRLTPAPEYLMLSDALAFDVRAYDAGAPLYEAAGGTVVQPGDPGWFIEAAKPSPVVVGFGAYCDLGWAWDGATLLYNPALPLPTGVQAPLFNTLRRVGWHPMLTNAGAALRSYPCVYDTWSFHYENDGIDQEGELVRTDPQGVYKDEVPLPQFASWRLNTLDQGTNGLDDDNLNGVDDMGERETSPPYNTPLRGVKVSLRIYERDARQIREVSVTHSFAE